MHIAFYADPIDNQRAGVHMYTKYLIENLNKLDKKNRYTYIHRKENDFFKGMEEIILPPPNIIAKETIRKFILQPRLTNKLNPDIIFEPSHIGPFGINKNIKRAVLIHDLTPVLTPQFHVRKSTRTHKLLLPSILGNADLIITPSQHTKNDILKHYNTNALIKVVYPGKNPIHPTHKKPEIDTPYILSLGTIEPRKNLPTLIDAFLELKAKSNIPHKLVLAGGVGWKAEETLKKTDHPDIILTGYITEEEKTGWLKYADLFVYPSFYEGFGIPPMEAMQHKIPTITSTGGSLKEIYENHSLTFDPLDKEKLLSHIKKLIFNKPYANKLADRAYEYTKQFTWEKTALRTIEAFEEVMNKN